MSSFTIAKRDYIKAAGLTAGIAKGLDVWLFDYETRRDTKKEGLKSPLLFQIHAGSRTVPGRFLSASCPFSILSG